MAQKPNEKRKNERYDTAVEVYFHYPYDIHTKVDYQLTDKSGNKPLSPIYKGTSRNVSAEGLCFRSKKELHGGDNLYIELHLPGGHDPIHLDGTVRWCHVANNKKGYDTGVRLLHVNGKSVPETIYFDETYHIEWSAVLEQILGEYRLISKERKNKSAP